MSIFNDIAGLIEEAKQKQLISVQDEIYVRNQLLAALKLETYPAKVSEVTKDTIPNILEKITSYATREKIIEDTFDDKEIFSAHIMDCFVARPSVINDLFHQNYAQSPKQATNYFYELSKNSNYIQMKRINKNIHYQAETTYGKLDITINLSKPEKDPKQIKRESELKQQTHYPSCVLCIENEGYAGRTGYPARANHRVIKIPLNGCNWYLQYSPYIYYNEHSILLSEEHQSMKMNADTFTDLLSFVEKFPHYFIGSNAELPIVGGSILGHSHYQAGQYEFTMTRTDAAWDFKLDHFQNISATVLKWPMSVIRLKGKYKSDLIEAATHILRTWQGYKDPSANILPYTKDTPHNTITPIARHRDGAFELDIVLRNNRTSNEYPMGIFHPHEDVHHIKKENIGLIEVMGLAVLPARLKTELEEIKKFLLNEKHAIANYHKRWAMHLKEKYGTVTDSEKSEAIIRHELGVKYLKILEDAAVFKQTVTGKSAFQRFITTLNKK